MKIPKVLVHYKKHFDIWENSIHCGLILFLILQESMFRDKIIERLTYDDFERLKEAMTFKQARLQPIIKFYIDQKGFKQIMDSLDSHMQFKGKPKQSSSNQIFIY